MKKAFKVMLIVLSLTAFAFATSALAEEFFVVKEAAGQMVVTDKKPADAKIVVVKGPFKTKAEADAALKAAAEAAKPK